MNKHIKECAEVFLRDQGRLFDEQLEVFKLDDNHVYFFVQA